MRGKEVQGLLQDLVGGITPAYAGKSRTLSGLRFWKRDHPRVCGEKHDVMYDPDRDRGSPPRVRGKVKNATGIDAFSGITPACAGKRFVWFGLTPDGQDHPRVCGEKDPVFPGLLLHLGSPPRVRGKEFWGCCCAGCHRITPACAGKSCNLSGVLCQFRDHPRVCGEKTAIHLSAASSSGSPPRVRGKADKTKLEKVWGGITPACAGKSDIRNSSLKKLLGSPPRVRGKVKTPQKGLQRPRITPACAGKRLMSLNSPTAQRDHPRVCGEKLLDKISSSLAWGSPPRVRGKAVQQQQTTCKPGITPACAGKR